VQAGMRPCSKVEAGNFTTSIYSVLLSVGKIVLKMMETLWKNSHIVAKGVWVIHLNVIVIVVTFSEKKLEALLCTVPCSFLSGNLKGLTKVYYFSDGEASQFKNRKNFINICYKKCDFGLNAKWHFFAVSHGKGACDGIGGRIKRLAGMASLQNPY
jgi:hypothetical protein